jgi:hypothetical protein
VGLDREIGISIISHIQELHVTSLGCTDNLKENKRKRELWQGKIQIHQQSKQTSISQSAIVTFPGSSPG